MKFLFENLSKLSFKVCRHKGQIAISQYNPVEHNAYVNTKWGRRGPKQRIYCLETKNNCNDIPLETLYIFVRIR